MLNDLIEKHKIAYKAITNMNSLAKTHIPNVGAAVSFKPVEYIPLVVAWVFNSIEGQDFFKWLTSASFEPTLKQIITTAEHLVEPYSKEMPYEVLLNDYGFTLCEYWRPKPAMPAKKQFETQLHQRLYHLIMGMEGVDHATYRSTNSERPNWICLFTLGGTHQTHDLTFAMNLNQHLFFDPRVGEFGCKTLLHLCEFVSDYVFSIYPNTCDKFFMYLLDKPTEIQVSSKKISSNDKPTNPKKSISVT